MTENLMNTYSHSKINCFKQCPKMYEYKYIDKLDPIGSKEALNIGKSVHKGIELGSSDGALEYMEQEKFFTDEKAETNKALVLAMVDAYLERWGNEKMIHEVEFRLPLKENCELLGYIDGIIEEDEGYWLEETKTASLVNADYIDKLQYTDQITKYLLAIRELKEQLGLDVNKPVLGIKYRVLRKPMIRQKKDESIDQFRKRLVEKFTDEADDYVFEFILNRTDEELDECKEDLLEDINQIESAKRFTKTLSSCSMYGRCPYMELCMKQENARLLYVERKKEEEQDVTGE